MKIFEKKTFYALNKQKKNIEMLYSCSVQILCIKGKCGKCDDLFLVTYFTDMGKYNLNEMC